MSTSYTLLLVALITLSACGVNSNEEIEQSIMFNEPKAQEFFVKKMGELNYQYRIGEGGQVFYPYKNRKIVKQLQVEVISIYHPPYAFGSSNHALLSKVKNALRESGIAYREVELSKQTKISWDEKDDAEAKKIVRMLW